MAKNKKKKTNLYRKSSMRAVSNTPDVLEDRILYYNLPGSTVLTVTPYWDIMTEKLLYNEKTLKQVSDITKLLERENFNKVLMRASLKRPNLPFIVLLHGPSGTGKTALVRDICRQTKRHMLEIRVEKLRNEHVGQDEKAAKIVFEDYLVAASALEEFPIMFFDECESILCKRMAQTGSNPGLVNDINNVVTMWLKEFQNFHGILFLATNRKEDLDDAFARRVLFQIDVDHPTKETQAAIWEHLFPRVLTPEQCKSLAEETNFSGGQIKQVQTKAEILEILHGKLNYDTIREVCETNGKATTERKTIGFKC